jgi:hypothetical protein
MEMLRKIQHTREKLLGGTHIATGEAKYITVRTGIYTSYYEYHYILTYMY